jgi:hypothetical protein
MPTEEPTDTAVVETASEAAEGVVLDRYRQSELKDLDITVTFEDGVLEDLTPAVGAVNEIIDDLLDVADGHDAPTVAALLAVLVGGSPDREVRAARHRRN